MQAISGLLHNWKLDKPTLNGGIRLMYNLLESSLSRGTNVATLLTLPNKEKNLVGTNTIIKAYHFSEIDQHALHALQMNHLKRLKKPHIEDIKDKRNLNYFLGCNSTRVDANNYVTYNSKKIKCALVIDGTLTDKPVKSWDREFDVKMEKEGNIAELLLKIMLRGDRIDDIFPSAAFSSGLMSKDGLMFYTNGKRPLYIFRSNKVIGFASTKQIIMDFIAIAKRERSVIDLSIQRATPETMYFAKVIGTRGGILTEKINGVEKLSEYGTNVKWFN